MRRVLGMGAVVAAAMVGLSAPSSPLLAVVVDAVTRAPIPNAIVTIGSAETRTDERGTFRVSDLGAATIRVRAYGYGRTEVAVNTLQRPPAEIPLGRVHPKAVYLSVFGIGNRTLREAALDLVETTDLNALVIDVKGDRGIIGYRSTIALASQVGAQRVITMPDLPGLLSMLRQRGIYTIARIVVFKDDLLASARRDLAVLRRDGSIYRDGEGLAWTDPHSAEVRAYNIGVAGEAAQAGFDEIQFDYARLPDTTGLVFRAADTQQNRVAAIGGFLREARTALVPYNVFLAIDVFGYVCWNPDDTRIGQQLERIAEVVDYISPMLYPSSFQFGIPGFRNPVQHPDEIVRRSLEKALERTRLPAVRFRPWLQAFPDYAFGGRPFTGGEVRAQILRRRFWSLREARHRSYCDGHARAYRCQAMGTRERCREGPSRGGQNCCSGQSGPAGVTAASALRNCGVACSTSDWAIESVAGDGFTRRSRRRQRSPGAWESRQGRFAETLSKA